MTTRTGTSAAAAITAGAAANLLGWGIVEGNYPTMSEASVKATLYGEHKEIQRSHTRTVSLDMERWICFKPFFVCGNSHPAA